MTTSHFVNVAFTFTGVVEVKGAENKQAAIEIVKRDFGICLGDPHTTNDEQVVNWDIETHAAKVEYK